MGEIGKLVQEHIDAQPYRVSVAQVAGAVGVSRQALTLWIDGSSLPKPENLRSLARALGLPYSRVLDAALVDHGYLPKESDGSGTAAPTNPPRAVKATKAPSRRRSGTGASQPPP